MHVGMAAINRVQPCSEHGPRGVAINGRHIFLAIIVATTEPNTGGGAYNYMSISI